MEARTALFYNRNGTSKEHNLTLLPKKVETLPRTEHGGVYRIETPLISPDAWRLFDEILDLNDDKRSLELEIDHTPSVSRRYKLEEIMQVDRLLNWIGYVSPNQLESSISRIIPVNTMFYKLSSLMSNRAKSYRFLTMNQNSLRSQIEAAYYDNAEYFKVNNLFLMYSWGIGSKANVFLSINDHPVLLRQFNFLNVWSLELIEAIYDLELLKKADLDWVAEEYDDETIDVERARELLDQTAIDDLSEFQSLLNVIRIYPFLPDSLKQSLKTHKRLKRFFRNADKTIQREQSNYLFDFLPYYHRMLGSYTITSLPHVENGSNLPKLDRQYIWNTISLNDALILKSFDGVCHSLQTGVGIEEQLMRFIQSDAYLIDSEPGLTLSLVLEAIVLLKISLENLRRLFEYIARFVERSSGMFDLSSDVPMMGVRAFLYGLRVYIEERQRL